MPELTFILESDTGRVTVEASSVDRELSEAITRVLGEAEYLNCARPTGHGHDSKSAARNHIKASPSETSSADLSAACLWLFRIYHYSTVDGPGRRSVIQFAGCSIRCPGCYVPETHVSENGSLISVERIIDEVDGRRSEHDGVTIIGGEPFDQIAGLARLVEKLKAKHYHITLYTGHTLEALVEYPNPLIIEILANTDLLIDGPFRRDLTERAGEYRGSRNQRLIRNPMTNIIMNKTMQTGDNSDAKPLIEEREALEEFLGDATAPTDCPEGCMVGHDGACPHGYESLTLRLGFV